MRIVSRILRNRPLLEQLTDMWGSDDPAIYDGAHVSVQVVGRRLQEEKMLALAEYIAGVLHK